MMPLTIDLHSHSGYSGGVGQIELSKIIEAMKLKGLDVFGTGDCLHPLWSKHLKESLVEEHPGLFSLKGFDKKKLLMLQTEVIVSFPFGKKRKSFHLILLFPSFQAIEKVVMLLEKWGVKNTIGRPFITCDSLKELSDRLSAIKEASPWIEQIPAHIMTPDGFFGSENPIYSIEEAFGDFSKQIQIIETGLSADPQILEMIPELKTKTFISNSDCHSADLRRIGREFTCIKGEKLSYEGILTDLRQNNVLYTGEFSVLEGRYFLTGHRKGKKGHEEKGICFSPNKTPENKICPICGKKLTVGVLERAYELAEKQGGKHEIPHQTKRKYLTLVPLIEAIAVSIKKSEISKTVMEIYLKIVTAVPETQFWALSNTEITALLKSFQSDDRLIQGILEVKNGNFYYDPIGFDGSYGELKIGKKIEIGSLSINRIYE